MATEKRPLYYTPAGLADYPYLVKPDMGSENFRNTTGIYKLGLKLDPNDDAHAEFIASLEEENRAYHAALAKKEPKKSVICKSPRMPFKAEVDKNGEETGMVIIKFKSQHKPRLFDSARQPIIGDVNVGSGSKVKVAFTKNFYYMASSNEVGMNLYLNCVQIIDLVEYTGGEAPEGFGEEQGYQADQPPPKETFGGDYDDRKGDGAPDERKPGYDDDDIPGLEKVKANPKQAFVDAALKSDPKLPDMCAAAGMTDEDLIAIWEAANGNSAMFKIKVRTACSKKQKGSK